MDRCASGMGKPYVGLEILGCEYNGESQREELVAIQGEEEGGRAQDCSMGLIDEC